MLLCENKGSCSPFVITTLQGLGISQNLKVYEAQQIVNKIQDKCISNLE